jgi:hypothetical protein
MIPGDILTCIRAGPLKQRFSDQRYAVTVKFPRECTLFLAAVVALAGCDQPAPISLPRETPKPEKESFSGFTSGTPLPLSQAADPRVADEPSATPSPSATPEAQAAMQDYAQTLRDLRTDPATHPPENFDASDSAALQRLNNAIIGHIQAIEDAQDRVRATKKKELGEGE